MPIKSFMGVARCVVNGDGTKSIEFCALRGENPRLCAQSRRRVRDGMTTPTQSSLAAGEVASPDHAHEQAHEQAYEQAHARGQSQLALTVLALGIVYGDIGTSPLYAMKETFNPAHGIGLDTASVLGGVSTILWALMIVVTLKYVVLVMRADNRGEGGIMALLALAASAGRRCFWVRRC
jgi:ABC-type nickel/cobalt efflux system permease component RcnA